MEEGAKVLELAKNVLITCAVLGTALLISRFVADSQMRSNDTILHLYSGKEGKSGWSSYNGKVIQGDEVLYLAENYNVFFRVSTSKSPTGFINFEHSRDKTSMSYINQTDEFVCAQVNDSEGDLIGLTITEVGYALANNSREVSGATSYYDSISSSAQLKAQEAEHSADTYRESYPGAGVSDLADDEYRELYRQYVYYTNLQGITSAVEGGM